MPKIKLNTRYLWKGEFFGSEDGIPTEVEVPDEFLQVYPHLKPPDISPPQPQQPPEPQPEPQVETQSAKQQGGKK